MNFSKYINLPYRLKGRDFKGVDCFGIIWLIYKEELGITLPDFLNVDYDDTWYKNGKNHILNEMGTFNDKLWSRAEKPYQLFDGLIFYLSSKKIANHCGMYIGDNKVIHVFEDSTSQVDRVDSGFMRLYGVIRYINLKEERQ